MEDKKLNFGPFIGGLALIAIAILTLCHPEAFVKIIVVFASIAAFVDGIYTLFVFKQWAFVGITRKLTLIKGILMSVSGIIGIIMPLVAARAVVSIVVYVFAVMLLYSAFVSIQDAFVIRKLDYTVPRLHFYVEAVFSVFVAVIFFANPQSVLSTIVSVIGITGIAIGLGLIIYAFIGRK